MSVSQLEADEGVQALLVVDECGPAERTKLLHRLGPDSRKRIRIPTIYNQESKPMVTIGGSMCLLSVLSRSSRSCRSTSAKSTFDTGRTCAKDHPGWPISLGRISGIIRTSRCATAMGF